MSDFAIDTNSLLESMPGRMPLPPVGGPLAAPAQVTPQVTPQPAPPPQAIQTAPPPTPMPLPPAPTPAAPDFDDNEKYDEWVQAERDAFLPDRVRSHHGDRRPIDLEARKADPKAHPDWAEYEQLKQVVPAIKDTKRRREAEMYFKRLEGRIKSETDKESKSSQQAARDRARLELSKIDGDQVRVSQAPEVNQQITDQYGKLLTVQKERMKGGAKERQESDGYIRRSPYTTMGDDERVTLARKLVALNPGMDGNDAARLVLDLGTPPERGTVGRNGYRGKAAADYVPFNVDAVGNYFLKTGYGTIRVDPDSYKLFGSARSKGYTNMLKYSKELEEARKKEAEPGMIGQAIDWTRKQLK